MKIFHHHHHHQQQTRGAQLCGKYDSGSEEVKVEYERMDTNDTPLVSGEAKKPVLKRKFWKMVVAIISTMATAFLVLCLLIAVDKRRATGTCDQRSQVDCCPGGQEAQGGCTPDKETRLTGDENEFQLLKSFVNRTRLRLFMILNRARQLIEPSLFPSGFRNVTSSVHLAGTSANNHLRDVIVHHLRSSTSFRPSATQVYKYSALLSYPNWERPNTVRVIRGGRDVALDRGPPATDWNERPWDHPEVFTSYVAYSPNASVTGKLQFANYGEEGDYAELDKPGRDWKGSVVLVRLRERHLSGVVGVAEKKEVAGVLLFVEEQNHHYGNATLERMSSSSSSSHSFHRTSPSPSSPSPSPPSSSSSPASSSNISESTPVTAPSPLNNSHSLSHPSNASLPTPPFSSSSSSSSSSFSPSSSSSSSSPSSFSSSPMLLISPQTVDRVSKISFEMPTFTLSSPPPPPPQSSSSSSPPRPRLDNYMERIAPRMTLWHMGDPLTPDLPSKEGMIGADDDLQFDLQALPKIPVQIVGMQTARHLMRLLNNQSTSSPAGAVEEESVLVTLDVMNSLERRDIFDVITRIEGVEEPDRYVIVGCRYDAWSYGAMEGGSGTSVLMEVSLALSRLVSNDWKPRRTILLAYWDAGEMGEIGSTEWVEEHRLELVDRTIVYINLDSAVTGLGSARGEINPMLRSLMVDLITDLDVSGVDEEFSNLFDFWISKNPSENDPFLPRFDAPSASSDQLPFLYYLGVPTIWPQLVDQDAGKTISLRHTSLSTFSHVAQHVDPEFRGHELMTLLTLELVRRISSEVKLPFDVREVAETLERDFNSLPVDALDDFKTALDQLQKAIREFSISSVLFHDNFQQLDDSEYVQMCNERLMKVSRSFIPRDFSKRGKRSSASISRSLLSELSPAAVDSFGLLSMLRDSMEGYLAENDPPPDESTPQTTASSSAASASSSSSSSSSSSATTEGVWSVENSPTSTPSQFPPPPPQPPPSPTPKKRAAGEATRAPPPKIGRGSLLRQISMTTLAIESATRILDIPEDYE